MFTALDVENILTLFKRVLLDTSNLLVSDDPAKLVNCCEAIKALIFPFKFELVYVPLLPEILLDRVGTPFIFMLGVETKLYEKAFDEQIIKDGTFIFNLDTNKQTSIEDFNYDEDLPDLPLKH